MSVVSQVEADGLHSQVVSVHTHCRRQCSRTSVCTTRELCLYVEWEGAPEIPVHVDDNYIKTEQHQFIVTLSVALSEVSRNPRYVSNTVVG